MAHWISPQHHALQKSLKNTEKRYKTSETEDVFPFTLTSNLNFGWCASKLDGAPPQPVAHVPIRNAQPENN